ncbi:MAG: hypothetical protein A2Y95_09270 [Deltaproteobacteria bacterium RBG_13_65_10]|nr:MAG: hypothetical protein A2Y95_09270 [Deltaproteobacteria bacterium RBG_13_65_10]
MGKRRSAVGPIGRACGLGTVLLIFLLWAAAVAGPARADEGTEVLFTQGLVALRKGDLAGARNRLDRAVESDPGDAVAWYWLGVVRMRAGDNRAAVDAFDRALDLQPDYAEAILARGNALSRLGDQKAAREAWSRAAEAAVGSPVEREARRQLEVPRRVAAHPDWDLSASLGAEYDTNVLLFPNLGDAPPRPDGRTGPIDHRRDARFIYFLNGGYRFVNNDAWALGTRQTLYAATQFRTEDVSLVDYSPSFYVNRKTERATFGLEYMFTLFGLRGSAFLTRHRLEPSVTVREGSTGFTRAFYRYDASIFQTPGDRHLDRSGSTHTVGIDQYVLLFDRRGYARAGTSFTRNLTRGTEFDGNDFSLSGEMVAPLPADLRLWVRGEQRWAHYDHKSFYSRPGALFLLTGERKREKFTSASATLFRPLGKHWSIAGRYSYFVNQSTVDAFDYNRNIYSLVATYSF